MTVTVIVIVVVSVVVVGVAVVAVDVVVVFVAGVVVVLIIRGSRNSKSHPGICDATGRIKKKNAKKLSRPIVTVQDAEVL